MLDGREYVLIYLEASLRLSPAHHACSDQQSKKALLPRRLDIAR